MLSKMKIGIQMKMRMKMMNKVLIGFLAFLLPTIAFAQECCQVGRFKPCVCWEDVPKEVSYLPKDKRCGGNASIVLRGSLYNSFSAVVRDKENRDRWPVSGFNGCSFELANSDAPPNRCSAFKAQKIIKKTYTREKIHCLGNPGTHKNFKNVVRITVKVSDITKEIRRYCLRSPTRKLN